MELVLGYWLDGRTYPDEWTGTEASMGKKITGYQGLVNLLETHAGYVMPTIAETTRIAEWQAAIERLNDGTKPYSNSFETDSWHTAQELMLRRDELIIAGWHPSLAEGSDWLRAIAEIELSITDKSLGFSDRVRTILNLLEAKEIDIPIRKIALVDQDQTLLDSWMQNILNLLQQNGVEILQYAAEISNDQLLQTDLQKIKYALAHNEPIELLQLENDGSFILVHAEQEWDLADFLASWLQVYGDDQSVVINDSNDVMLAEMMHRRGLPANEVMKNSQARSVLQVLPLVLETYWQPIRVDKFLELFTLPSSPIPRTLASSLARVLTEEPGIGGEKWKQAIETSVQRIHQRWREDASISPQKRSNKIKELEEKIQLYIEHPFYKVADGIPLEIIENVCGHLSSWALKNYIIGGELYLKLRQMINDLLSSLQALNVDTISQLQLTNIYNAVIGDGAKLSNYKAELSSWQTVRKPGAIFNRVKNVIWWQFIDSSSSPKNKWSLTEREYLLANGVQLTPTQKVRKRETNAWHTAVQFTEEKFICLVPTKVRGEDAKAHPLLDEFKYAVEKFGEKIAEVSFDAKLLKLQDVYSNFEFERNQLTYQNLPASIREWRVPQENITLREKESATSMEKLLRCPLDWTFKYVAKIQSSPTLSLPNESKMLGNLGHKILEHLINEDIFAQIDQIEIKTEQLFNDIVPQMAAPLLLPEQESNRRHILINLQKSMRQFARFVQEAEITVQETEKLISKPWSETIEFEGRLDLYGKTKSGRSLTIDAKWSKHSKRYKELLEQGSIQLALYHWLLAEEDEDVIPIAYFMLASGEVFTFPDDELPKDKHIVGKSMQETLAIIRRELNETMQKLSSGQAIATGVAPLNADPTASDEEQVRAYEPNCRFCDYQQLCGVGGTVK